MYILPPVTTSGNTYVARHLFGDDNSHSDDSNDSPTRDSFSPSPTATSSITTPSNQPDVVIASSPSKKDGLAPWIIGLIVALVVIIVAISLFFAGRWYMKRRRAQKISRTKWRWLGRDANLDSNSEKTVVGNDLISQTYDTASVRSDSLASRWSYHGPNLTIEDGVPVGNGASHYSTNVAHNQHSPSSIVNPSLTPLAFAAQQQNYSHSIRSTSSSSSSKRSASRVAGPPNDVYTLSNGGDITNLGLPFTLATMQRPFVRSLTDELSASVGQQIGIIQEYNDGWTLCVILDEHGMIGGQGMIPSECLNKSPF